MKTKLLVLGLSSIFLLLGNVVRSFRHARLFPNDMVPRRSDLLLALSVAQLVNFVIPLRLGDILRIALLSSRYRVASAYVAATVAVERISDITLVAIAGAITITMVMYDTLRSWEGTSILVLVATLLVVAAIGTAYSPLMRRTIWVLSGVFNARIQLWCADFTWSIATLIKSRVLFRQGFVLDTIVMWCFYLTSYALFAHAMRLNTFAVSFAMLDLPQRPVIFQVIGSGVGQSGFILLAVVGGSIALVLLYGLLNINHPLVRMIQQLRRKSSILDTRPPIFPRSNYQSLKDYETFLDSTFSGTQSIVAKMGTLGLGEAVVRRILPGGSDAVAAVVEERGQLLIRKCADGSAGCKLAEQAKWLRDYATLLPLTPVQDERQIKDLFVYDMPYRPSAQDFFNVVHSQPLEKSQVILAEVVDRVAQFHHKTTKGEASIELVTAYLRDKVAANAHAVVDYARSLFPEGRYSVNGHEFNLSEWDCLTDPVWLGQQIKNRETASIHGDLTIENIIVDPAFPGGWYLIDPNAGNIFDSPFIDWAKLMQSLNLGYEIFNRGYNAVVDGQNIRLSFSRSALYARLHGYYYTLLEERFGVVGVREIAFHEMVNYLRLTPYKIRNTPQKAATFLACTSILLRQYTMLEQSNNIIRPDHAPLYATDKESN